MMQNGIMPLIFYCNPNIYPEEEYRIRKDECTRYAESLGLEIVDAEALVVIQQTCGILLPVFRIAA